MKKYAFIVIVFLAFIGQFSAQPCPEGIQLQSQSDIDEFPENYPDCKDIDGILSIWQLSGSDPIINLDGLISIESVSGYFEIRGCTSLKDISGLGSLKTVGGDFTIGENPQLDSLSGLDSLTAVGGDFYITWMNDLVSLNGLEQLSSIGGVLSLNGNNKLENIQALKNLTSIGPVLSIIVNNKLTSLDGIENIAPGSISTLTIFQNELLSECAVESVCAVLLNPDVYYTQINNNAMGCSSEEEVLEGCTTFTEDLNLDNSFSVYPNPASNQVTIVSRYNQQIREIILYDQFGQKMQTVLNNNKLDISDLRSGIYFLTIESAQTISCQKLVVSY